jgi:preprotein translocase subunit SecA
MKFLAGLAASILVLTTPAPAQTADPKMTKAERAELIELMNKSEKEFLQAVEGLSEQQWSFKPGPDRWSVAECAEHIVLAEALLFETATTSLTATVDDKWEETLRKTDVLRRALPNRSTKVDAPAAIKPRQAMTRQQLMARFKEQRARALAYVQETEAPLKAHTAANPFFGPLNAHQWLLYIPLHHLRHNLQIAEVKTSSSYPQ